MATASGVVEIRALGPLEVLVDGSAVSTGGPVRRAALAYLALGPGRAVSADELAEAIWGDLAFERDRGTLQVHVHKLREALGPRGKQILLTGDAGYSIDTGTVQVDAIEWAAQVATAEEAGRRTDWEAAAESYAAALDQWRGPPFTDISTPLLDALRRHWEEQWLTVSEHWADASLCAGRHDTIVGALRQLVESQPLHEPFWAQLMLALYRSGRQADALHEFQEARSHLIDELGLDPGPALRRLEESILRQSARLELSEAGPALHWLEPAGRARTHPLADRRDVIVGRGSDCGIILSHDRLVSRRHCHLEWRGGRWWVVDDGSANGTILNGRRLDGRAELRNRDVLRCGETSLLVMLSDDSDFGGAPPSLGTTARPRI